MRLIVGGAARDSILGRPVRDIDLILPTSLRTSQLPLLGSGSGSGSVSGSGSISNHPAGPGELDIQFSDNPMSHIRNYTINLCKVALDLDRRLYIMTEEFIRDVRDRMITFLPNDIWPEWKQLDHLDRVRAKYPDFGVRLA